MVGLAIGLLVTASPVEMARGSSSLPSFTLNLTASAVGGATPSLVDFEALLTPNTTLAEFYWTFGDGHTFSENATGKSDPTHTYAVPATYLATVTANASSGTVEQSIAVVVPAGNLTATILATPSLAPDELTVTFDAEISGGTGTFASILWSTGDGGSGAGATLVHNYTAAGRYFVTLQVADTRGDRANTSIQLQVGAAGPGGSGGVGGLSGILAWELGAALVVAVAAAVSLVFWWFRARGRPSRIDSEVEAELLDGEMGLAPASEGEAVGTGGGNEGSRLTPALDESPSSAPPVTPRMGAGGPEEPRRVTEQVLTHLLRFSRSPSGDLPLEATQQGMVRSLRVTQNSLSKVLTRLVAAGVVRVETRHVPGVARRVKAYSLTPRGEAVARGLARGAPPARPSGGSNP
jgi:hypothetical protein